MIIICVFDFRNQIRIRLNLNLVIRFELDSPLDFGIVYKEPREKKSSLVQLIIITNNLKALSNL